MAVIKPVSEKKRTGRHMELATPHKLKKILADIALGIPYEIAATANRLSPAHLYNCILQGEIDIAEGDDTPHASLVEGLRVIEKNAIASCLADIRPAEKGHRGAEWILERRFWKHFSPNVPTMELAAQMEEFKKILAESQKLKGNKDEKE